MTRRHIAFVLIAALTSLGASHRTPNFVVQAPTPQIAERVGQWAEYYRREKAIMWLGHEMPPWPQPCPLVVQVTMNGPSGATSFNFGQNQVLSQHMEIQGPLDRLIASVLPHEITHTVFAYYYKQPVPRWADEGGSVLSEDEIEKERHDRLTRQILNQGRQIPMRRLFALREYPRDVVCLYAQGFSMADFLVKRTDRRTYLLFVGHGMQHGWDHAVQAFYGHRSVEELEQAWIEYLRNPQQLEILAQNRKQQANPNTVVRLTVPPVQPVGPAPVVRGQTPYANEDPQFGQMNTYQNNAPSYAGAPGPAWQPTGGQQGAQVPVQLGHPQFEMMPAQGPAYPGPSPVGYPQ